MSADPADVRIAELLAQRAWVRSLARALVHDEAAADDLEQETWLAALESPPTWRTSPRGWLAAVLRRRAARRARTGSRVARRERAAARPEATASASEVVAEAEEHRHVVDAVLDLSEEQRTAVLLRFYEGLPPREIARRTGAPVETVRARVRRGLEQVRERFDREHRGDRRAWRAALAPLVGGGAVPEGPGVSGAATGAAGAMVMASTTTKVAIAAAALLALGWVGWTLWPAEARQEPTRDALERADAKPQESGGPTLAAGAGKPAAGPAPVVPEAPAARRAGLRIVAKDDGKPLAAARAVALGADGRRVEAAADADGLAAFPGDLAFARVVWARAPGFVPARRTDLDLAAGATVALERGPSVRVTFVDRGDATLTAEHVAARFQADGGTPGAEWIWPEAFAPSGMREFFATRIDGGATWRLATTLALADDAASPGDAVPVEGARLLVHLPGGTPWVSAALDPASTQDVVVRVDPAVRLTLRLVADEDGAPLTGATARLYAEYGDDALFLAGPDLPANADGRVTIGLPPDEPRKRGPSLLLEAPGRAQWVGFGTLQTWAKRAAEEVSEVRIPRTATVEGRAWTPAGEPAAGWEVVSPQRGLVRRARVSPDGSFRLEGLAPWRIPATPNGATKASLMLRDAEGSGLPAAAEVAVTPGQTAKADLGTPKSVPRTGFRGRVKAGERPLSGQFVGLVSEEGKRPDRLFAVTDADGRYELRDVPPGTWRVTVLIGNPHVSDDFVLKSRVGSVVKAGEMTTIDLTLPEGAVRVLVVDAATGKPIPGAMTAARFEKRDPRREWAPGFEGTLGSSAVLNAEGRARLEGFPLGEPLEVAGFAEGYAEGQVKGVLAGTGDGAPEVIVKLTKK